MIVYQAKIIDEETGEVLIQISSNSEEGLMEEMSKRKWIDAVRQYKLKSEELSEQQESEESKLQESQFADTDFDKTDNEDLGAKI